MSKELHLRLLPPDDLQEVSAQLPYLEENYRLYRFWLQSIGVETEEEARNQCNLSGYYERGSGRIIKPSIQDYTQGNTEYYQTLIQYVLNGAVDFDTAKKRYKEDLHVFYKRARAQLASKNELRSSSTTSLGTATLSS